jgi:hypothetical protein
MADNWWENKKEGEEPISPYSYGAFPFWNPIKEGVQSTIDFIKKYSAGGGLVEGLPIGNVARDFIKGVPPITTGGSELQKKTGGGTNWTINFGPQREEPKMPSNPVSSAFPSPGITGGDIVRSNREYRNLNPERPVLFPPISGINTENMNQVDQWGNRIPTAPPVPTSYYTLGANNEFEPINFNQFTQGFQRQGIPIGPEPGSETTGQWQQRMGLPGREVSETMRDYRLSRLENRMPYRGPEPDMVLRSTQNPYEFDVLKKVQFGGPATAGNPQWQEVGMKYSPQKGFYERSALPMEQERSPYWNVDVRRGNVWPITREQSNMMTTMGPGEENPPIQMVGPYPGGSQIVTRGERGFYEVPPEQMFKKEYAIAELHRIAETEKQAGTLTLEKQKGMNAIATAIATVEAGSKKTMGDYALAIITPAHKEIDNDISIRPENKEKAKEVATRIGIETAMAIKERERIYKEQGRGIPTEPGLPTGEAGTKPSLGPKVDILESMWNTIKADMKRNKVKQADQDAYEQRFNIIRGR